MSLSPYQIHEVDGAQNAEQIFRFNAMVPAFPQLRLRHLVEGFWWFAFLDDKPVAFAGMVPYHPHDHVAYFKRCHVMHDHHGHGIQFRMMMVREVKARQTGCTMILSDCAASNVHSANNFRRAGFELVEPEQPWAESAGPSLYWRKVLA